jgi:riboflavin kinase
LKRIEINGEIFSGESKGKVFLDLPWVRRQIKEKIGFIPYPGTLNIRLFGKSGERWRICENERSIEVSQTKGYYNGKLYKCSIGNRECAIVVPEIEGYPKDVLEIIADVNLRETLQLEDGDEVTVTVNL